MTQIDQLLEPIRRSPRMPEVVSRLVAELAAEQRKREAFYRDMTPSQKVEFIDGEVFMHSPARSVHVDVTIRITSLLRAFVSKHRLGKVGAEKCLCVFPRNDYEPDVVYFGLEKYVTITDDTLKHPVPDLAVEILSPSTEDNDRGVKFEDYAANGVREYWIVDAKAGVLEQYLLRDGTYQLKKHSGSGVLASEVVSGFKVPLASFFDEEAYLEALRSLLG